MKMTMAERKMATTARMIPAMAPDERPFVLVMATGLVSTADALVSVEKETGDDALSESEVVDELEIEELDDMSPVAEGPQRHESRVRSGSQKEGGKY